MKFEYEYSALSLKGHIMKKGIFIALAALALAVFAVPDAYGNSGPDVNQRFSGSNFLVDFDEETESSVFLPNVIAKGQPGRAALHGRSRVGPPLLDNIPDSRCPQGFPIGSDLVFFRFVETYNDGSLLTGQANDGQAVCANFRGDFVFDTEGFITGGTGRFDEDATGTWRITGFDPLGNSSVTGTFTADLD